MYIYRKSDGVDFGNDTRGHITTPLAKAKLMCASSKMLLHSGHTTAMEIPHEDKNSDWSACASCVFSFSC